MFGRRAAANQTFQRIEAVQLRMASQVPKCVSRSASCRAFNHDPVIQPCNTAICPCLTGETPISIAMVQCVSRLVPSNLLTLLHSPDSISDSPEPRSGSRLSSRRSCPALLTSSRLLPQFFSSNPSSSTTSRCFFFSFSPLRRYNKPALSGRKAQASRCHERSGRQAPSRNRRRYRLRHRLLWPGRKALDRRGKIKTILLAHGSRPGRPLECP